MKQVFVLTTCAIAFAALVTGCASDTTEGSGELGSVGVNLLVGDTDVKAVSFELVCDSGFALNGQFNVNDEQDPPIWAAIMDVPVPNPETGEPCSIVLIASDDAGNVLCTGEESFVVEVNETVKVDLVLLCGEEGDDPLGNIDIDATFQIIEGNNCPRLHFLNAVPDEVPAEGSEVTVWVSDKDDDTLTTQLTATSGSFGQASSVLTNTADPVSVLTTYSCENGGEQTISVSVTDGDDACDKSKSFDVVCPGVDPCEGVVCDDTGNQCTVGVCTNESAPDCVETNVENGISCEAGGITDLADNGGVEEGTLNGWVTEFCTPPDFSGPCTADNTMANTGQWSARIFNDVPGTPSVLKQANKGVGIVQPGDEVTITFWAKGVGVNGGVGFAEFFTELEGGGTSNSILLGNAPLSLLPDQFQFFSFTVPVGDPAGGGVTVQFNAATGATPGSTMELFVDDVAITFEGGGAGTCQEGVCEPSAECTVETVVEDCGPTNNECIDPVCNAGTCGTSNNTNACDNNTGTCNAGVCEPNVDVFYEEDFESLDQTSGTALGDADFLVFGNEFLPDGTPIQGYGPFPAPNGTPGFSSIALGQGGGPQGEQVLVIYSDYNNGANQEAGNLVEANTFQEPYSNPDTLITLADLGTYTFSFDAKRGDINDPTLPRCDSTNVEYTPNPPCDSTALAFIKTLDPGAGFATTNFFTVDTTAIPDTWNRYSITLVVDNALIGQVLQFGFAATATNFEPSGVFYDNLLVTVE